MAKKKHGSAETHRSQNSVTRTEKEEMATPDLPQEILIDIFSRLPTKSVGRCRCLSKLYYSLLSTAEFIKLHLACSPRQENVILIENRSHSLHAITPPIADGNISRNINLLNTWTMVLGSCNGLVLLANDDRDIYLANPITLEYVKILDSPFNLEEEKTLSMYGFGYDCSSDDYKIVALSYYDIHDLDYVDTFVEVYSMKRGVWKSVDDYILDVPEFHRGALVNSAIHWLARSRESRNTFVIATCDLVNETFHEIPSPIDDGSVICQLVVLWCCLCIFTLYNSVTSLWVMKEYGLIESWTKFSVDVDPRWNVDKPICLIGEEEVLLLNIDLSLVVYNLKEKMVSDGVPGYFIDGGTFVESLVSPAFSVSN